MRAVSSAVPPSLLVMTIGDALMKIADVTVVTTVQTAPTKRAVLPLNVRSCLLRFFYFFICIEDSLIQIEVLIHI